MSAQGRQFRLNACLDGRVTRFGASGEMEGKGLVFFQKEVLSFHSIARSRVEVVEGIQPTQLLLETWRSMKCQENITLTGATCAV